VGRLREEVRRGKVKGVIRFESEGGEVRGWGSCGSESIVRVELSGLGRTLMSEPIFVSFLRM
jgi:hypothetical protein